MVEDDIPASQKIYRIPFIFHDIVAEPRPHIADNHMAGYHYERIILKAYSITWSGLAGNSYIGIINL